jgi:hypothetical protein
MAATIGVPLYACGGGTIPLLQGWLAQGMSMGSAAAFMITGPATKITNLGALKIVLGKRNFLLYILFVMLSAVFGLMVGLGRKKMFPPRSAGRTSSHHYKAHSASFGWLNAASPAFLAALAFWWISLNSFSRFSSSVLTTAKSPLRM